MTATATHMTDKLLVDCGATSHIANNPERFIEYALTLNQPNITLNLQMEEGAMSWLPHVEWPPSQSLTKMV